MNAPAETVSTETAPTETAPTETHVAETAMVEIAAVGANANAYAALSEADGWFAARGQAAWGVAGDDARSAALIRAADWLDGQFRFRGSRITAGQARAWPRAGIGGAVSAGGLPGPVRTAYFELALALLDGEAAAERLIGLQGAVRRERVGGLAIEYEPSGASGGRLRALLAPYLRTGLATRIART